MLRERWQRIDPVARLKGHSMKTKFELELADVKAVAAAAEAEASETQVKAAFLLNFPKYVEWPVEAHATTNSPITMHSSATHRTSFT